MPIYVRDAKPEVSGQKKDHLQTDKPQTHPPTCTCTHTWPSGAATLTGRCRPMPWRPSPAPRAAPSSAPPLGPSAALGGAQASARQASASSGSATTVGGWGQAGQRHSGQRSPDVDGGGRPEYREGRSCGPVRYASGAGRHCPMKHTTQHTDPTVFFCFDGQRCAIWVAALQVGPKPSEAKKKKTVYVVQSEQKSPENMFFVILGRSDSKK